MEWIGWLAAGLTTVSFVPQALRVIRTRETEAISLWMYILFILGIGAWLAYGFVLEDTPMIIANTITLSMASIILVFKILDN